MSDDYIYYNISQFVNNDKNGNPVQSEAVEFSSSRADTILDNPSQYEIAVARFSVPSSLIPILILDQPSPYFVTLLYLGDSYSENLEYVPRTNNPNPTYPFAIWNIKQLTFIINQAYDRAFTSLKADHPAFAGTLAPSLAYDAATRLVEFVVQPAFQSESQTGIPTVEICMGADLYINFFPSFNVFQYKAGIAPNDEPTDIYKIFVQINGRGLNIIEIQGNTYITVEQEFPTIGLWNEFIGITFETSRIPINNELLPTQNDVTRAILTDFNIPAGINDKGYLQFQPQGLQLRWNTLQSQVPLNSIDIKAYWTDNQGVLYPIFIPRFGTFSMKLAFRKKQEFRQKPNPIPTELDFQLKHDPDEALQRMINDIVDIEGRRSYNPDPNELKLYKENAQEKAHVELHANRFKRPETYLKDTNETKETELQNENENENEKENIT